MEKIEYITNQFKKTFGKKYENYCISRIYALVGRDDFKIVTQQMFKRKDNNIALADLYLPQINMWIEVNEEHHKKRELEDAERTAEVIELNKKSEKVKIKYDALNEVITSNIEKPYIIDVYDKSLEEINKQIYDKVKIINSRIDDSYIPWNQANDDPL